MVNSLEDPFLIVKQEIQDNIQKIHEIYGSTQQLLSSHQGRLHQPASPSKVKEETRKNIALLKQLIESVEFDMKDMDAALINVQANSSKYRTEAKELPKRREFVKLIQASLITSKNEVASLETRLSQLELSQQAADRNNLLSSGAEPKLGKHGYAPLARPPLTSILKSDAEIESESKNPYFYEVHLAQQRQHLSKQDEQLDAMATTVGTIREQAYLIHSELGDQAVLLNDMDGQLVHVDGKFNRVSRRLDRFYASSKKGSGKWIVFLMLVLIALIVVLIVT